MRSRPETLRLAILISIAVALVLLVWPTPFRYESSCGRLVRINRVTGTAAVLLDDGWTTLKPNPVDNMIRTKESERLGYWVVSSLVCPSYK